MNEMSRVPEAEEASNVSEAGEGMSEDQLKQLLSTEIEDGLSYIYQTENIAPERERNYNYYRGRMDDLPAPPGRSQITDRAVSTYIDMMVPSLMRIFTAGQNIVEYEPVGDEDEQVADLITQYVNEVVFRKDNNGETLLYDWIWDSLVSKVGVIKAVWREDFETKEETYEGLSDQEYEQILLAVENSEDLQITALGEETVEAEGVDPLTGLPAVMVQTTHDVTVERKINRSRIHMEVLTDDEFVISRDARSLEEAVLVSHRTYIRAGDLVDEGYDREMVDRLPTYYEHRYRRTQREDEGYFNERNRTDSADPMLREVLIHEGIVKCDWDGTGVKEWYFKCGGDSNLVEVLDMEPYECQVVFADLCPQPIPGLFWGECPADRLVEIQKVETVLKRQLLDNVYLHNSPQREVVFDWLVNPQQLSNMAPGAPVYVKQPGAVREIQIPFIGGAVLPLIEHFDTEAEGRTGVSRSAMGLDPDTLQNQSATAANIAFSASQGKVELIARLYASGGMRKLFRGILKMLIRYQDYARVVRLNGQAQAIDPREWEAFGDMDVSINTGLGTGNRDRDAAFMDQVIGEIKDLIMQYGPNNPIAGINEYVEAANMGMEARGLKKMKLFKSPPENWPPPQEPSQDPKMLELQQKAQESQAKLQLETQKAQAQLELERAKSAEQIRIAQEVEQAKLQTALQEVERKHALEVEKMEREYQLKWTELEKEAELELIAIRTKAASGNGQIPNER